MDSQILSTLQEIRWGVYFLLSLYGIHLSLYVISSIYTNISRFKETADRSFSNNCATSLDRGDYDDVLKLCEGVLSKRPSNALALWYKGKALFHQKRYNHARTCFLQAADYEPSYEESTDVYLKKISAETESTINK